MPTPVAPTARRPAAAALMLLALALLTFTAAGCDSNDRSGVIPVDETMEEPTV